MAEQTYARTIEPSRSTRWPSLIGWFLIIGALVAGFAQNFVEMWIRWFPAWRWSGEHTLYERIIGGTSYYTHGPIVPLVSLLIVLLLVRFTKVPVRPRPGWGFLVLLGSLSVHLVSCHARVNFSSGFALIGVLAGVILIVWGATALRRLWFPLAFLAFMVPLPEVSIAQLNFRLKMFATAWGVRLANFIGIIAVRSANEVFLDGDKRLVIGDVCNGLRTLITVIGFGALYTYVCRLRGIWRIVLFLTSVPVAVVANSIRIVALIVVAHIWDEKVATGWFHDTSGALIFLMAFLMMFGVERLILWLRALRGKAVGDDRLFEDVRRGREDARQASKLFSAANSRSVLSTVVLLACCAGGALWLYFSEPSSSSPSPNWLPRALHVAGKNWHSYDMELDPHTEAKLEHPLYLCRRYVTPGMPHVEFSIIYSLNNRKGTHPPDLCIGNIIAKRPVVVNGIEGRSEIECRELVAKPPGMREQHILYLYKCGDTYTTSFWKQQFIILINGLLRRDASGGLIRMWTPVVNRDVKEARRLSEEFLRVIIPYVDTLFENLRRQQE